MFIEISSSSAHFFKKTRISVGKAPNKDQGEDKAKRKKPAFPCDGYGANERNRTADLLITNQLLYQLSYVGPCLVTTDFITLNEKIPPVAFFQLKC